MITPFIRLGIRSLPVLVILLVVVELLVTNELAGFGSKVHEVNGAIEIVKEENQLLQEKVASLSSLLTIEQKARELGFITNPPSIVLGGEDVAFHLQP